MFTWNLFYGGPVLKKYLPNLSNSFNDIVYIYAIALGDMNVLQYYFQQHNQNEAEHHIKQLKHITVNLIFNFVFVHKYLPTA